MPYRYHDPERDRRLRLARTILLGLVFAFGLVVGVAGGRGNPGGLPIVIVTCCAYVAGLVTPVLIWVVSDTD